MVFREMVSYGFFQAIQPKGGGDRIKRGNNQCLQPLKRKSKLTKFIAIVQEKTRVEEE